MNINTTNDWMLALADAMANGNILALEELENISAGWMQTDEDRQAQRALLEAAEQLLCEIPV
jgi:hypothetical protein